MFPAGRLSIARRVLDQMGAIQRFANVSGMPAERGLEVLRQIDPTAEIVPDGDGWRVRHAIVSDGEQPSPTGPDRDHLLQRMVFVLSFARSVQAGGRTWRWRLGAHRPGDHHWDEVA